MLHDLPARPRLVLGLLALLSLALPLAACGGGGGSAVDGPSTGTYRAYIVRNGTDTTEVAEGDLAGPIPTASMVSVDLPPHSGQIRVDNTRWQISDSLRASAFLLRYRNPDGTVSVYTTSFSTARFCPVDSADAGLRAVTIEPMWLGQEAEHAMSVFDVDGNDSLAAIPLTAPSGRVGVTTLQSGATAVQDQAVLKLEVQWADGAERPLVVAWRTNDDYWYGALIDRDASASVPPGTVAYEASFAIGAAHPEVYLVALEE